MPPTNLDKVTVEAQYFMLDGSYANGTVSFTSTTVLVDPIAEEIIIPETIIAALDNQGRISVDLPVTNDPDLDPQGFTYSVVEQIQGGGGRSYNIEVGYAGPDPLDLAAISPVAANPAPPANYITLSQLAAMRNIPGGIAGLDGNGRVSLSNLPFAFGPTPPADTSLIWFKTG